MTLNHQTKNGKRKLKNDVTEHPKIYQDELPDIKPSDTHFVLYDYKPNVKGKNPAMKHNEKGKNCVIMPYDKRTFITSNDSKDRWQYIQDVLRKNYNTIENIPATIYEYNSQHGYDISWDIRILQNIFSQENMRTLIPKMIDLALKLKELVPQKIPLLHSGRSASISLTQIQIASLLANAFFCTFPKRNNNQTFKNYPSINFNSLFQSFQQYETIPGEKMKCILNYFHRVTMKEPEGVVTFCRVNVKTDEFPQWIQSEKPLIQVAIEPNGAIETVQNALQVDFANKMVGGGVLGRGCVQEEIRFLMFPELIVSRLFTEALDDNEVLIVAGAERYNNYLGYASSFQYNGNHDDITPRDSSGRRQCTVVAMDATNFDDSYNTVDDQFSKSAMDRELNKAYVGFKKHNTNNSMVATGNWGCGVFRGNPHVKFVLQYIAASENQRLGMVYFTGGDAKLADELIEIQNNLIENYKSVGKVYGKLLKFRHSGITDYYSFIMKKESMDENSTIGSKMSQIQRQKRKVNSENQMTSFPVEESMNEEHGNTGAPQNCSGNRQSNLIEDNTHKSRGNTHECMPFQKPQQDLETSAKQEKIEQKVQRKKKPSSTSEYNKNKASYNTQVIRTIQKSQTISDSAKKQAVSEYARLQSNELPKSCTDKTHNAIQFNANHASQQMCGSSSNQEENKHADQLVNKPSDTSKDNAHSAIDNTQNLMVNQNSLQNCEDTSNQEEIDEKNVMENKPSNSSEDNKHIACDNNKLFNENSTSQQSSEAALNLTIKDNDHGDLQENKCSNSSEEIKLNAFDNTKLLKENLTSQQSYGNASNQEENE